MVPPRSSWIWTRRRLMEEILPVGHQEDQWGQTLSRPRFGHSAGPDWRWQEKCRGSSKSLSQSHFHLFSRHLQVLDAVHCLFRLSEESGHRVCFGCRASSPSKLKTHVTCADSAPFLIRAVQTRRLSPCSTRTFASSWGVEVSHSLT